MTTSRKSKLKARPKARPAPDPKLLLPKLHVRLENERAGLDRWQKRLVRAFHAYERQHRLVARLERRIARLESI
jgi:hypothetical protein